MGVLVTGAQGCIGAWVVKQLLEQGHDVTIFDLDNHFRRLQLIASPDLIRRAHVEMGRIEDTVRVKALVRERRIKHIVHLAAVLMPFCQGKPVEGAMINVVGTLSVFEAARDAGWPVRVVYASSSAVWGPEDAYEDRPLKETDPLLPATHYGVFKQANEGNARVFYAANGISSIGLRPWTVYGVGRDTGLTAAPTLAMKAAALGREYQIRLTGHMDLQYVEDVAATFLACLFSPLEGAHVFNLAGDVVTMESLIGLLDELRPGSAKLICARGPRVPVAHRMDASRLHSLIGEIPRTPLKEGAQKTLDLFEALRRTGAIADAID